MFWEECGKDVFTCSHATLILCYLVEGEKKAPYSTL